MTQDRRRLGILCSLVFAVACLVRLHFAVGVFTAWQELPPDSPARLESGFMRRDSASYIRPARILLTGNIVNAGSVRRPPGYPFFLALFGVSFLPVLVAQSFVSSLVPVAATLLVHKLSGRLLVAAAGGISLALSPTGVALSALIMADLLLGVLVAISVLLIALAARDRRNDYLLVAGALLGFATLVKPLLLLWWPLSLVLFWLFGGASLRTVGRRTVLLFLAFQLVPAFGWSMRNLVADGVLTFSSIGPLTARSYLMARTEAFVELGREPTRPEIWEKQIAVRQRYRAMGAEWGPRVRQYRRENREIFVESPGATTRAFIRSIRDNLHGGWRLWDEQLPGTAPPANYLRASALEGALRAMVPVMLLISLAAATAAWLLTRNRQDLQRTKDIIALGLVWAFFVLACGVTFWTGPRILYPAQIAVIPACLLGCLGIIEVVKAVWLRMRVPG